MNNNIQIKFISQDLIKSYRDCVDEVAKERKYLACTEAFPLETVEAFVKNIINKNYPQYIAIKNKEVIGWCDILPKELEGFSHVGRLGMGLKKSYRNKGIGKKLIEKTIYHSKTIGLEKVELEVFESNKIAIEFYKKFGFKEEGLLIKSRKIDGIYDNIIIMGYFL
jgi:ribosomal protein S18 acetylase RimI-like enzyme